MIRPDWKGVYPAVTTQIDAEDTIDFEGFFANVDVQRDAGIHGIVLAGSLGEASTLGDEEKLELLERSVERYGNDLPVVLNIAEQTTRKAAWFAEQAERRNASGLMLLPPMRYKADGRETVAFMQAVAASTSLPILVYNNPVDYGIEVTVEMFEELLERDNIEAVKESTRDTANVTRLRNAFGDRLKILCGVDPLAIEELIMGADGWVAGLVNAFPKETVEIYRLVQGGRVDDARRLHAWFLPLLELDIHPKLVQYIKLAEQIEGIGSEHVRAPRLTLAGEERAHVEAVVREALSSRPVLEAT